MKKIIFLSFVFISLFLSCGSKTSEYALSDKAKLVDNFLKDVAKRSSSEKLLSYFEKDADIIDINIEENNSPDFYYNNAYWLLEKYSPHPDFIEVVDSIMITENENHVVAYGKFTPYYYNKTPVMSSAFFMIFKFSKNNLISEQKMYINYPFEELYQMYQLKQSIQGGGIESDF